MAHAPLVGRPGVAVDPGQGARAVYPRGPRLPAANASEGRPVRRPLSKIVRGRPDADRLREVHSLRQDLHPAHLRYVSSIRSAWVAGTVRVSAERQGWLVAPHLNQPPRFALCLCGRSYEYACHTISQQSNYCRHRCGDRQRANPRITRPIALVGAFHYWGPAQPSTVLEPSSTLQRQRGDSWRR
jgi:hypothetical protein